MPEIKTEESWIPWSVKQPENPGMYWWRLKSAVLPELTLVFIDAAIKRNGVIAAPFSHWDGWRSRIPPCEWKPLKENILHTRGLNLLAVEGLEFQTCPFCGKIPRLLGCRRIDGGMLITATPQNYNYWSLCCCEWGCSPEYKDPRELERIRREAFARVKETSCPKN